MPNRLADNPDSDNAAPTSQVLTRIHLIVFAIVVVLALVAWALWMHRWQARVARKNEMRRLYSLAIGGDLDSVRRLSEYPSSEAIPWLEKLVQQRDATGDSRVAAITALGSNPSLDRATLAPLLQIDQPFVVRHAAAEVLEKSGCDQACILATLAALHAIWTGQPTLEVQAAAQIPSPTQHDQEDLLYLHKQTEEDYSALLNTNPCLARNLLGTDYPSDSPFVDEVRKSLHPCQVR